MLVEFLKVGVLIICEHSEISLHILRFVFKNMTVFNTTQFWNITESSSNTYSGSDSSMLEEVFLRML